MLAISLRFPAGRYHATPWGRHVNEGVAEWPPSPWRLLRALVAVWRRVFPSWSADKVRRVLAPLAEEAPGFFLPPAGVAHTRHYMPWEKKGPGDRTLVFDTFVVVGRREPVVAVWRQAELADAERYLLEQLLAHLNYFGRAESWCDARLLSAQEARERPMRINCEPMTPSPQALVAQFPTGAREHLTPSPQALVAQSLTGASDAETPSPRPLSPKGARGHRSMEPVRVLCADPAAVFLNDWTPKAGAARQTARSKAARGASIANGAGPIYNPDWHLCLETLHIHKERWSHVPGSRWVTYLRPSDCFRLAARRGRGRSGWHPSLGPAADAEPTEKPRRTITVARFALDGVVLPLVTETLPTAEAVRRALLFHYARVAQRRLGIRDATDPRCRSRILEGKDEAGPLKGHGHAYYLPTDEDDDGRIDHVTVFAADGLASLELQALDRLRKIRLGESELRVLLVGLGVTGDFRSPLFGPSAVWRSATPFLVTRHLKRNGRKRDRPELFVRENALEFARQVLQEELARRPGLPAVAQVDAEADGVRRGANRLRCIQFRRQRRKRGDDGTGRAVGSFRIQFANPVSGPLALGHSCHFGLGLFMPALAP